MAATVEQGEAFSRYNLACIVVAVFLGLSCSSAAVSPQRLGPTSSAEAPGRAPEQNGALAAAEEPTGASSTEPFRVESCSVERSGPNVAILHCGAMDLKVMRPSTMDFEALLSQLGTKWQRQTVDLAGTSFPGAVLADRSSRFGVLVAALQTPEPRFVTCFVDASMRNGEAACRAALSTLLVDGAIPQIQLGGASLGLADRELKVPDGCTLVGADRIRCPSAELHWRDPSPACRTTAESLKEGLEGLLARVGKVTHSTRACAVLGEQRTCEHYTLEPKGQPRVTILASIRGCEYPMAQCNFLSPPSQSFPQPCDQVFSGTP